MTEQEREEGMAHLEHREEQQWGRCQLALAVWLVAERNHSGQWSKGYAKLCQAERVLDGLGFRPGAMGMPVREPDVRGLAAAYLARHRRDVRRNW